MALTQTHPSAPIAAGSQVVVRDEEWLVRSISPTAADGTMVRCIGLSTLVKDTEATFFTTHDEIIPLRPEETSLVIDDSPNFRDSRLYLEAVIRKTPVPSTETGLAVAEHQLLRQLDYQKRATHKALTGLRPRLLIADAVGLGKTLEVGLILSELIRRGRGERILVVTPKHILEQFQHELWTRFAIPLVRLDSEGIAQVRRKIPSNRNPFTYYKRSIISIDTLKNAGRYRHHLESIRWDAVVIDECHNLVNKGTLNNQLARVLAPRTEALLLTSATPHNGDPESFAELIRLLDPTAIVDPKKINPADIEHLYVRRHKNHDEVASEVSGDWADRKEPKALMVDASSEENALFRELADTWTHPISGKPPTGGRGASLFPWTLFKSALSSHHAMAQTVSNRRHKLAKEADEETGLTADKQVEDDALAKLEELTATIGDAQSSKLAVLLEQLKEIGVGPRSKTRVVIFSERIATLDWLAETVPTALKLKAKNIRVLHGGLADLRQMEVIEEFGLADSDVRILFTGDMASEGVNLHRECNHLIHYDLPWSLITIEQRNGRIDRYGQLNSPDVRALLLTPDHKKLTGDVRVITKLLDREHHAHKAFGEAGSLLGLHDVKLEEAAVIERLKSGSSPDSIPDRPADEFDLMALLTGGTGFDPVPTFNSPSLFESEKVFVDEALRAAFTDASNALDLRRDSADPAFYSFTPPNDLVNRIKSLPQSYLKEQGLATRFKLTGDAVNAEEHLARARQSSMSSWPEIGYLSPLHPFLGWLVDKVLISVGRNEAPVLAANVAAPVFCVQGMHSNGRGQPQIVDWYAITETLGQTVVANMFEVLDRIGVKPGMANPGHDPDIAALEAMIPSAIVSARAKLEEHRREHDAELDHILSTPARRLTNWVKESNQLSLMLNERDRRDKDKLVGLVKNDTQSLIDSMRTVGEPLIRVVAVIVPLSSGSINKAGGNY